MKNIASTFQKSAQAIKAPPDLQERVLFAIKTAETRQSRANQALWGVLSVFSVVAFAASSIYAARMFSTSGFTSYFSLIFSDLHSALSLWRELGLSLIESLPIVGLGIFLASTCALLWSIRKFIRSGQNLITSPRIA